MSEFKVKGGRRRARVARRITWFGVYLMRYGTALAAIWLIGCVLNVFGLVALGGSAGGQFLFAAGLVLVTRLLGVALLALAGTLVPRARPLLSSALVLMPSTAHTRRPTDRHPEEGSRSEPPQRHPSSSRKRLLSFRVGPNQSVKVDLDRSRMRTGFLATVAVAAAAAFASSASAEVITPEVVKPDVVTPHQVTAPAEPSAAPAAAPSPEASPTPEAAPEAATSEDPAAADDAAPQDPSPQNQPVGGNDVKFYPGPYPLNVSVANYNNALALIYTVTGIFGSASEQEMILRSINIVRHTDILLGGEGRGTRTEGPDAGSPATSTGSPATPRPALAGGKRSDEDPVKNEE